MKSTTITAVSLGSLLAIYAATPALAEAKTLKWAHVYESSEPFHTCAVAASDDLSERTNGAYNIEVFPASSLGKESDLNEALAFGSVDIIYTGQLFAGRSYSPISIGGAPFMFRDFDHWNAYRGSELFAKLSDGYQSATGHYITALTYFGDRHVISNTPISTPEEMQGLKIRVPNAPLYEMFPRAVGANPTPIAFSEVYLALQQGAVDAAEGPMTAIKGKKFYEVTDYINLTGHITEALLTVVSGGTWSDLSDDDRAALQAAIDTASNCATDDIIAQEKVLADWFKENGATVNVVDRTPFREATQKMFSGPDATWDSETFDALQAIK
jgi:tripartite ATP-independent transporter DctP family solute receptor